MAAGAASAQPARTKASCKWPWAFLSCVAGVSTSRTVWTEALGPRSRIRKCSWPSCCEASMSEASTPQRSSKEASSRTISALASAASANADAVGAPGALAPGGGGCSLASVSSQSAFESRTVTQGRPTSSRRLRTIANAGSRCSCNGVVSARMASAVRARRLSRLLSKPWNFSKSTCFGKRARIGEGGGGSVQLCANEALPNCGISAVDCTATADCAAATAAAAAVPELIAAAAPSAVAAAAAGGGVGDPRAWDVASLAAGAAGGGAAVTAAAVGLHAFGLVGRRSLPAQRLLLG
mmetsp:Transcript_150256/g.482834  ORF Transcript_150256/g.482834 Transcript_150256/m.482834 type:complete len:295 (+) Transcript_150256:2363-3247(+)